MPSFPRHARRRNLEGIEAFYNPEGVFREVLLLSLGEEGQGEVPAEYGSVRVVDLGLARPHPHLILLGETAFGLLDRVSRAVLALAKRHRVDLLVQRYGSPLWHGVPIVWAARQLSLPSIITYQSENKVWETGAVGLARRMADGGTYRYLNEHATAIWTVSEALRERAIEAGVAAAKLVAIPNKDQLSRYATPRTPEERTELFSRLGIAARDTAPLFLVVGRLIPEKNHSRVIEGFAHAAREAPDARCLIVGSGPLEGELRELIEARSLGKAVQITTELLGQDELAVLYQHATALLFCSTSEGQGRVVYEALASGTPVIGADIPPVREMLVHGSNGFLVDPLDARDIGAAILSFCRGDAKKAELAEACQRSARRFDLSLVNPREAAFYQRVLDGETANA